jgi:UDP-N-acetylmuramate--alanine ligase
VEAAIPDLIAARERDVPLVHRADLLAHLLNAGGDAIAIGGTSGKSTVTGMTGYLLRELGAAPCVINGGIMLNAATPPYLGNAICGHGRVVAEVDESDGTIVKYHAGIAAVTSITEDHMPLPEIRALFTTFVEQCSGPVIYHAGCAESRALLAGRDGVVSVGIDIAADWRAEDVRPEGLGMRITLRGETVALPCPGRHNVQNALIAIALAEAAGLDWRAACRALAGFRGIHRRFEIIGNTRGVTVVDDFAHNPEKIAAVLAAATAAFPRVLAVFQPHGYGPTRFLREGLVEAIATGLRADDRMLFAPIYDAGGTADRSIASDDLAADLLARGVQAETLARESLPDHFAALAQPGDLILLMGARDPTLPDLARQFHDSLS